MTNDELEVARTVGKIKDPIAEAKRRWPDFRHEVKVQGSTTFLFAYWTRAGKRRGFKDPVPSSPSPQDITTALEHVATAALISAEHDRLAGAR